ncbi:unnamed protein product [Heterobilharzia americana]|nr:unnamed protein product [Heterobilharzia americana]
MMENIANNSLKETKTPTSSNIGSEAISDTSRIDDVSSVESSCHQEIVLAGTTYIPAVYEFRQQPILMLASQQPLQQSVSTSSAPLSFHFNVDYQQHQTTCTPLSNLHTTAAISSNKNSCRMNDIAKLSLIPLLPYHTSTTTDNIAQLQQSSVASPDVNPNTRRHFKRRVANYHHNQRSTGLAILEHSLNKTPVCNSHSAPSSLFSVAIARCSDLENHKNQQKKEVHYQHLRSFASANENDDGPDDHSVIVTNESIQTADRSLSNHSISNEQRNNLLTSSECLSSSLENHKLDDIIPSTTTTTSTTNNNNMSSIPDISGSSSNNGNFPVRSRSFFHLRQLDSPNSAGSHSTKPSTDILCCTSDSLNQLTVRVTSSPISISAVEDSHLSYYYYHHNHHLQQQQQDNYNPCSHNVNTTGNANTGGSIIKTKRGKCEKHISLEKPVGVRSYSAMRHPNGCGSRVFRSPLDVLAPCKGKLRVDIEYQNHIIKLQVIEAKGLRASGGQNCSSFVKVSITPEKGNHFEQTTQTVENPQHLTKYGRRIHLAVYAHSGQESESEFLGGMSFGIESIQNKEHISGWYYLLDEKMYRKKHLKTALDPNANLETGFCPNHDLVITDAAKTAITVITTSTQTAAVAASAVTTTTAAVASNQDPTWWTYSNQQSPMNFELATDQSVKSLPNEMHFVANSNTTVKNNTSHNYSTNDTSLRESHSVITPANYMIYSQNLPNTMLAYPIITPTMNTYLAELSPPASSRVNISIPNTNKALSNMQIFQFLIQKGSKGFGFTLCGNCPVYVSHVEPGSPAMQCGIQAGDFIVAVDNLNVSRSTSDSVVRMFRMSQHPVHITISRPILMKSNTSALNIAPSTSGKSLGSLINKSCFSALKKSSSESTKLTQPTNILKLSQTTSPSSPNYCHHQHQQHLPSAVSVRLSTAPLHSCSSTDFTSAKLSSYFTSPNLLCQSTSTLCPSMNDDNSNSIGATAKFSVPQSTSLHQAMNKHVVRTNLKNSQTDLQIASILSQNQQQQYPQRQMNDSSEVASTGPLCTENHPLSNKQVCHHHGTEQSNHKTNSTLHECVVNPTSTLQHSQSILDEKALGYCSFYNINTIGQAYHHHHQQQQQQQLQPMSLMMMMKMTTTSTATPSGINYPNYHSSAHLEHHGWLNLLDSSGWKRVELLLFRDLLLIAQKHSNGYFNVIRDPIYNTKISYINIPPYASDQLILQYVNEGNRKRIVHFQGSDVHDWLVRIQRHMVYNGNWWLGGSCSASEY